jgi:hypothetical protein
MLLGDDPAVNGVYDKFFLWAPEVYMLGEEVQR